MKWLLLALGGYVLYEYFYGQPVISTSASPAGNTVTTSSGSTGGTTVVTTPPPQGSTGAGSGSVAPTGSGISAAALIAKAGGRNSLTPQQWNYYYAQLSGQPVSASHVISASSTPIDVTTYLARRATAGLSGFSVQGLSRFTPDYQPNKYFRGMSR